MDNENKNRKANPNKAGMYFSLFICILALAIGTFSAVTRKNELYDSSSVTTEPVVEIRKNKTDVKKETSSTTKAEENQATTVTEQKKNTTTQKVTISPVANRFIMPLGGKVDKKFDKEKMQYSQTYGDWRLHTGIDISAKSGTRVFASGKGKVIKVYTDEALGNTVVIDHGNSTIAYYSGLGNITVKKGDILEIGTRIGTVGEIPSEIAEQPHIHFEIEINGEKADPLKILETKID